MEILNRSQPSVVSSVLASLEASCVRDQHTDLLLRVWSLFSFTVLASLSISEFKVLLQHSVSNNQAPCGLKHLVVLS